MTHYKKEVMLLIVVMLSLMVLSGSVKAITGSMGNARMVLYPEVDGKTETVIEKSILTKNVNDVPINVTLVADEDAANFLKVVDNSFILQPGEEKSAGFEVRVKKEGVFVGKINVFFRPTEGKEPGVVLTSTIIVNAKKDQNYDDTQDNEDSFFDENNEDEEGDSGITGGSVGVGENKKVNPAIFLALTTFALVVVLVFLISIMKKRKGNGSRKKNGK